MKIMVTGAAGFIGGFVVDELLRRQHHLVALVRSSAPTRWSQLANLEVMETDLRQPERLDLGGKGINVVLHLAAVTASSGMQSFEDTVTTTANLLLALRQAGIRRIVGISSTAVLDYRAVLPMAVIDEQVTIADGAGACDYAASKIRQERLLMDFAKEAGNACTILRPGLVYDESRLTVACAGVIKGRIGLLANHGGEVPTIAVQALATAIANAAERQFERCEVIHLVDDHLPSQSTYIGGLLRRGLLPRMRIVLPWRVLQGLCYFAGAVLVSLGFRDKVPELMLPRGFSRRLKPFRFSNAKARRVLNWTPGQEFV